METTLPSIAGKSRCFSLCSVNTVIMRKIDTNLFFIGSLKKGSIPKLM